MELGLRMLEATLPSGVLRIISAFHELERLSFEWHLGGRGM